MYGKSPLSSYASKSGASGKKRKPKDPRVEALKRMAS